VPLPIETGDRARVGRGFEMSVLGMNAGYAPSLCECRPGSTIRRRPAAESREGPGPLAVGPLATPNPPAHRHASYANASSRLLPRMWLSQDGVTGRERWRGHHGAF
jgi:hypothetical protein